MVNPDGIRIAESKSITTPDISRVQVGDGNILNNDVRRARKTKPFAVQRRPVRSYQRLVGLDVDPSGRCSIDFDAVRCGVATAIKSVEERLAAILRGARVGVAGVDSGSSLGASEVECAVDDDVLRLARFEIGDEVFDSGGIDRLRTTTTSSSRSEPNWASIDDRGYLTLRKALSRSRCRQRHQDGKCRREERLHVEQN